MFLLKCVNIICIKTWTISLAAIAESERRSRTRKAPGALLLSLVPRAKSGAPPPTRLGAGAPSLPLGPDTVLDATHLCNLQLLKYVRIKDDN